MTRDELLARISIDPNICFGRPCIRGHRIWVSLVLDFLASGMSVQDLMAEYGIEEADVLACIAYGAEMARFADLAVPHEVLQRRPNAYPLSVIPQIHSAAPSSATGAAPAAR